MFKRIYDWIDSSPILSRWLEGISNLLARQRGLPVVVGIGLVIIGFIIQIIDVYAPSRVLELLGIVVHNVGILTALIGLLLADPLGK